MFVGLITTVSNILRKTQYVQQVAHQQDENRVTLSFCTQSKKIKKHDSTSA